MSSPPDNPAHGSDAAARRVASASSMDPAAGAPIELTKVNALIPTVAYGPIASRRLGNSLGINLLPGGMKICSFNCPYCECGWTDVTASRRRLDELPWPSLEQIERETSGALARCRDEDFPIHFLTMAGNGEPSMHPEFAGAVATLSRARDTYFPDARVAILSNAATVHEPEVRAVLDSLDERIMKLDAATPELIRQIDIPIVDYDLRRTVDGIKALRDCVIQTMFLEGRFTNARPADVDAWIELVAEIRPKYVQLYSLDRKAPDQTLRKVPARRLEEIARRLEEKTGVEGRVFG